MKKKLSKKEKELLILWKEMSKCCSYREYNEGNKCFSGNNESAFCAYGVCPIINGK